jgi:phosphoadenosine phosphosulfate reductase
MSEIYQLTRSDGKGTLPIDLPITCPICNKLVTAEDFEAGGMTASPSPAGVVVAFSGGKDSLALLDLCAQRFQRIEAFWLYWIKNLSFQEAVLEWAENRYHLKIYRLPHFGLPAVMDNQLLTWARASQRYLGRFTPRQLDDHVRRHFGLSWIASGEKKCDSLQRRGMLSQAGEWDEKRQHYYALANWSNRAVWAYLHSRRIPIPSEYLCLKRSFGGFRGEDLEAIAQQYPNDYARILEVFPNAEAIRKHWQFYGRAEAQARGAQAQSRRAATRQAHRAAKVRDGACVAEGHKELPVQPPAD